jgi:hypothetical protein
MRRSSVLLPAAAAVMTMSAAVDGDRHQETPRSADRNDAREQEHGT